MDRKHVLEVFASFHQKKTSFLLDLLNTPPILLMGYLASQAKNRTPFFKKLKSSFPPRRNILTSKIALNLNGKFFLFSKGGTWDMGKM